MRQIDLFGDGISCIGLEDFIKCSKSFDWFKTTTHLGIENEDEINEYYNLQYDLSNPPLYLADPLNATISGKTTFHCFKVLFDDGDSTLVVFRSNEFMKKRIQAFDIPISLLGDNGHSKLVIDTMLESGFVTFFFKEKYCSLFQKSYPREQYDDYYHDIDSEMDKFGNPKWQIDHGIRRITDGVSGYKIMDIHGMKPMVKPALECRRLWWERKGCEGMDSERRYFQNSLECNDERIRQIALVYGNMVLGVKTVIAYPERQYAVELMYSHVSRSRREILLSHPEMGNIVLSNIDECMRYAVVSMLSKEGIQREYWLGFMPKNHSLQNHKNIVSTGRIKYFSTVKL